MLAQFDGIQHDSLFGFAAPAVSAPVMAQSAAGDPLAVARLGDLLPLVLERYGYALADEGQVTPERRRRKRTDPASRAGDVGSDDQV